jgi:hypothetical protein
MNDGLLFQGHNADPWAGHTWYLSTTDQWWFQTWLKQGEREKAEKTLASVVYYGMSEAYQMLERYADNDPYGSPGCRTQRKRPFDPDVMRILWA